MIVTALYLIGWLSVFGLVSKIMRQSINVVLLRNYFTNESTLGWIDQHENVLE